DHDDLHRLHVGAVPGRREGGLRLARGPRGGAEHHLGRPTDESLADVVAAEGARIDHRRRRRVVRAPRLGPRRRVSRSYSVAETAREAGCPEDRVRWLGDIGLLTAGTE